VNFESFSSFKFLVNNRPLSQLALNFTAGLAYSGLKSRLSRDFRRLSKTFGGWWPVKSAA